MASQHYDAIVVGSGISGGWAAKELTEKGLKTLLLERGRNVVHVADYVNATKDPWELADRSMTAEGLRRDYPVLRRASYLYEPNVLFWANERECPYTEKRPFDWLRGYQVGGRSLLWGRHCLERS